LFITFSTTALNLGILPGVNFEEQQVIDGISTLSLVNLSPPDEINSSEPLEITADLEPDLAWELKIVTPSPGAISRLNVKKKRGLHERSCEPPPLPGKTKYFYFVRLLGITCCLFVICKTARNLIGPTLKRPDVATTHKELRAKLKTEEMSESRQKRNFALLTPEHWSCQTTYNWTTLSSDYYPRHVRKSAFASLCLLFP
jgi:hypothetical protein